MYIGKDEIHKCMQYEVSITVCEQIKEKYPTGCHSKTTSYNHLIFDVHRWRIYIQKYTKYEVSMIKIIATGEVCTDDTNDANDDEDANDADADDA